MPAVVQVGIRAALQQQPHQARFRKQRRAHQRRARVPGDAVVDVEPGVQEAGGDFEGSVGDGGEDEGRGGEAEVVESVVEGGEIAGPGGFCGEGFEKVGVWV